MNAGGGPPFNRILRLFRDDLARPEVQELDQALQEISRRYRELGRPLRHDFARVWENTHVLIELRRLAAAGRIQRILDLGGGNSPVSYYLAEQGYQVVVVDADPVVVEEITANANAFPPGGELDALLPAEGRWPIADDSIDAVSCISVFEGLLRGERALFWSEVRRVLKTGASLLMTFDYGVDGRYVGDPPTTIEEVMTEIVAASEMELVGEPPDEPVFDPEIGPPVKTVVPTIDGMDYLSIAYSFGALHLKKPAG